MKKAYNKIIEHYESCLEKHGDTHLGVDWPKKEDALKRYKVMLDILRLDDERKDPASLLDFGCGTAHLLDYMLENKYENFLYSGLDISQKFVDVAKEKYPQRTFYCLDILESNVDIQNFDYIIMNGVFTEKRELSFEDMWDYFTKMISAIYEKCNRGFAFNVMSKNVDWERDDLFHVSHDLLADFLCKNLTRNYIFRNDYGLYEYTVYVFKK
ncbi:Methyltransferase domain-containing protein [Flavobacterium resistens]|uniref:Methyltransferase n=1 Tax=Flavobacterium resistens TaxID=443612 RepID=A0A521ERN0_9FLAO|nr:class I SAM-dependent methyltransferase [Flavobacterium resistens]MRX67917.1 methyltransferase [Flavobacterium resistens]SMO86589.1 Methyltransferase domain-containing protein [Flavobacterium resistens]